MNDRKTTRDSYKLQIRMPETVEAAIRQRAELNGRSLTAEINQMLLTALNGVSEAAPFDRDAVAVAAMRSLARPSVNAMEVAAEAYMLADAMAEMRKQMP